MIARFAYRLVAVVCAWCALVSAGVAWSATNWLDSLAWAVVVVFASCAAACVVAAKTA